MLNATLIGVGMFLLLDVKRVQMKLPALLDFAQVLYKKHDPDMILVETSGVGQGFHDDLKRRIGNRVTSAECKGVDKIVRAESTTTLFAEGRVAVPSHAPWLEAFQREICAYPGGRNDDQVDAMVHFLRYAKPLMIRAILLGRKYHAYPGITTGDVLKGEPPRHDG